MDTVTSVATKPITSDSQTLPLHHSKASWEALRAVPATLIVRFPTILSFSSWKKKNCDENRFIKSNLCRQHLVWWKCCLTLTIPWNTNSLNWNYRGKNTTAIYLNFNYIIYAICRTLNSHSKLYIDWCTDRITPEFLYQDICHKWGMVYFPDY